MAIQWCDDFNSYGTNKAYLADGLYAENDITLTTDPEPGIDTYVVAIGQNDTLRKVLNTARATVGVCGRYWATELPVSAICHDVFVFRATDNTAQVTIAVDTNGYIKAYRGTSSAGTLLGTTTSLAVVPGAWQHIEAKVLSSDTVGTVEVRVEGEVVLSLTGQDTKAHASDANIYSVAFFGPSNGNARTFYIKDIVIWDTSGSYNNDFLGTVHVERLTPDSDVSFNWTASTGSTGFNLIDETPPDDADYIEASDAPPAASVMGLSNLPEDVTSVRALMTLVRAKKTDSGDGNLQVSLRSNGVDDDGVDRPMTTAETYWYDISEEDPDSSSAWTPTTVDAAEIVFNRTL